MWHELIDAGLDFAPLDPADQVLAPPGMDMMYRHDEIAEGSFIYKVDLLDEGPRTIHYPGHRE